MPSFGVRHPQERARVYGNPAFASVFERQRLATDLADGDCLPDQRASRGRSERHRHRRADQLALVADPPAAGLDLTRAGLGVDSLLALLEELEMLHRIGD